MGLKRTKKSGGKKSPVLHSEQGLKAILSQMSEGVVVENDRFQVEYMNRALVRRFGQQVGQKCYRAFIGRSTPCDDCSVKKIIVEGKKKFEYTAVDKNGRYYELVATPLHNEDGSISVIEVIRDVTEKRTAQEKIEREKEISQNIISCIAHGVITLDLSGRIISCNPAMRKKFHLPQGHLRGRRIWEVLKPVTAIQWRGAFQKVNRTGDPVHWGKLQIHNNGRSEVVDVKTVPMKDGSGATTGTINIFEFLTEKLVTESQLKEAKRFYEVLLHDIRESVLVIRKRQVIWCNRRVEEVLGYSPDELMGRTIARLFFGRKAYQKFSQAAYGTLEQADRYSSLLRLRTRAGNPVYIEFSLSAMERKGKKVTDVIAVGRNVTTRLKEEKEKRERVRRQAVLNKINAKITSSIDLEKVLRYSARSILQLTGLDGCSIVLYDVASGTLRDFASFGLNQRFQSSLKWRLRPGGVTEWVVKNRKPLMIPDTGKDPRSANSRATKLAGVKALAALPILSNGNVIGLIFINSFRTGAFQSEVIALAHSIASQAAVAIVNAKLYKQVSDKVTELSALHTVGQALVSTLDVPHLLNRVIQVLHESFGYRKCSILLYNRENNQLTISAAYGVPRQTVKSLSIDVNGKGITAWVVQTGNVLSVPDVRDDDRYVAGIGEIRSELAVPMKRGHEVIGVVDVESKELKAFGERDARVLSIVAAQVAMAIENARLFERAKKAYHDLKSAQADVVQAGRMAAVGQLAAGVAHELNNPIGGILGYAQFAASKMKSLQADPEQEEIKTNLIRYLGYIEKESQRCKEIVQNLLNFSRTSSGDYQPTDINKVINESLQFMEHNLIGNGILLKKRLSRRLPLVNGDAHQLQQVFINVILNAQKAMGHEGILTVISRRPRRFNGSKNMVEILFADTGCGIPQEHLDKIFEPFYTTRRIGEGTGLGLSVSYRIVKNHSGEIRVQSKVNCGTTFAVYLPTIESS